MTDDHRHETSLDLQFLGNLVNAEWLPELPLRESSKIDIRYCVLADTKAEGAASTCSTWLPFARSPKTKP